MIEGIFAILMMLGKYVLQAVYGTEGLKRRNIHDSFYYFFSLVIVVWLMCILFLATNSAKSDTDLCIAIVAVVPVTIFVWSIFTRKRVKRELEAEKNGEITHKRSKKPDSYYLN